MTEFWLSRFPLSTRIIMWPSAAHRLLEKLLGMDKLFEKWFGCKTKPCWLNLCAISQGDCHGSADSLLTTSFVCFCLTGQQKYLFKGKHKGCQTERENKQLRSDSTSQVMDQWPSAYVQINACIRATYTQMPPSRSSHLSGSSYSAPWFRQPRGLHATVSLHAQLLARVVLCPSLPSSRLCVFTFCLVVSWYLSIYLWIFCSLSAAFSLMANFYFMVICRRWIYR